MTQSILKTIEARNGNRISLIHMYNSVYLLKLVDGDTGKVIASTITTLNVGSDNFDRLVQLYRVQKHTFTDDVLEYRYW
jgi:hypothetical protein